VEIERLYLESLFGFMMRLRELGTKKKLKSEEETKRSLSPMISYI